jgi:hypothetical protein
MLDVSGTEVLAIRGLYWMVSFGRVKEELVEDGRGFEGKRA